MIKNLHLFFLFGNNNLSNTKTLFSIVLLAFFFILSTPKAFATDYVFTGSGNWTDVARWSPSYPNTTVSSSHTITIDGTCTVTSNLNLGGGTDFTVTVGGVFNMNKSMNVGSPAIVYGIFNVNSTTTIPSGRTLTIANGGTINVNAQLKNQGTLINEGTISGNSSGNLRIAGSTAMFTHDGTSVTINGMFEIEGNVTVNSSKTITITSSGTLLHEGNIVTFNGTLANEGTVTVNSGELLTIGATGAFTHDGINANINGTLTNSGTLSINTGKTLVIDATGTFTNNGILKGTGLIDSNGSTNIAGTVQPGNDAVGKLTTQDDIEFSGNIDIEITGRGGNTGSTAGTDFDQISSTNSATITVGSSTVDFDFGGNLPFNGDTYTIFSTGGTISGTPAIGTVSDGITMAYSGNGVFTVLNGGTISQNTFFAGVDNDWTDDDNWYGSAPYTTSGCSSGIDINEVLVIAADCDMSNANCIPSGRAYEFSKFITVNINVNWDINHTGIRFSIRGNGGLSNSGTMNFSRPFESRKVSTNTSTGIMNFNNGGQVNQTGSLINDNIVNISGIFDVQSTGTFTNNLGATCTLSGELEHDSGGTFTNNGTLKGTGIIDSNGSTNIAGTVQPGNDAVGKLRTQDNIEFSGNIDIEITGRGGNAGGTAGSDFDQISSTNSATITVGSSTVDFDFGGNLPVNGDTYTIFSTGGSVSGTPTIGTVSDGITMMHSGNGVFTVLTGGLPVELIDFSAKTIAENIILEWSTAAEINNQGFEIQHSINSRNWNKLNYVSGQGTTYEEQSYTYLDKNPYSGINYYRLKQLDYDGQYEYSPVAVVDFKNGQNSIHLFPNPVNDVLHINYLEAEEVSVRIYNSQGELLLEQLQKTNMLSVNHFPNGIYFVEVDTGKRIFRARFLKN